MVGHHEVQVFVFQDPGPWELPEGWKPYATERADNFGHGVHVYARKWVRHTEEPQASDKVEAYAALAKATEGEPSHGTYRL